MAFTLIELLVVIGLLAVFATISVAGYGAATRGMTDRGVVQSTASALRVAQQTCLMDLVPTKVLFFNQRLDDDDATLSHGTVVGIKQAGRITIDTSQSDGVLIDEFADWRQSYPPVGSASGQGMRLFNMNKDADSLAGCSSVVRVSVESYQLMEDYMIQAGKTITEWCNDSSHNRKNNDLVWGFRVESGGLSASDWKIGDPYGVEIVRVDLPKGYIFGKKIPDYKKMELVSVARFSPDKLDDKLRPQLDGGEVQIFLLQPSIGGGESIRLTEVGKVDSEMLKDGN